MEINTDDISSIEIINYSTNSYKLGRLVSLFKGLDFDIADFQVHHDGKSLKIYLGSNPKETNTSEGDE
jgi:hypothetical protein